MLIIVGSVVLGLIVLGLALKLAFPLPDRTQIPADDPVPEATSELAQSTASLSADHPDLTGIQLLPDGVSALAMRLALVRCAQRSIDARYYIWEDDVSGRMLLSEIIAAADRGVRVRLLIDDNPTAGLDPMWSAVAAHPNIAVRLFNPLTIRGARPLNYLFDFPRLNRRMHNKSLTVDDAATVVGGRNVGDAYFGAADDGLFIDLDALAVGAVVPAVAADFERYWTSDAAFPAAMILRGSEAGRLGSLRRTVVSDSAAVYRGATEAAIADLDSASLAAHLTWAKVRLFSDNPDKALDKSAREDLLAVQIAPYIRDAKQSFDLVSGYFVPAHAGTDLLTGLSRRHVDTRVITNGVAVTDVPVVHAGYVPWRRPLLAAGVKLFEARSLDGEDFSKRDLGQTNFSGGGESVHAKTFVIDDQRLFVGSFNFDPRSALLNCEMGLMIDSSDLAVAVTKTLDRRLVDHAYRVAMDRDKRIVWTRHQGGSVETFTTEPGTTPFERGMITGLSKLPIAWLL